MGVDAGGCVGDAYTSKGVGRLISITGSVL